MEYTIDKLAKLSGVSTRTLRYYDERGLLPPKAIRANGYRIYGQAELDRLQQILFYRELGVDLTAISRLLGAKEFDSAAALRTHLSVLHAKRAQLDTLITTVEKSIRAMKGDLKMSDAEKFEGFKQNLIDENERRYGTEIRKKYGGDTISRSNTKLKNMTEAEHAALKQLSQELNNALRDAFAQGDPASAAAQNVCALHKQWLSFYWAGYSPEAHLGVTQMYVDDPRFAAYYNKIAPGCAAFLRDAVRIFCKQPC